MTPLDNKLCEFHVGNMIDGYLPAFIFKIMENNCVEMMKNGTEIFFNREHHNDS